MSCEGHTQKSKENWQWKKTPLRDLRKRDPEGLIEKEEYSEETKEYIKKLLEPRGILGGFVASHNGLQPVQ